MNHAQQQILRSAVDHAYIITPKRQAKWLVTNGYMQVAEVHGPDLDNRHMAVALTTKGQSWLRQHEK